MFRLDERTRPWWALIGACMGLFVLMLDSTEVVLALPNIQRDLDASAPGLQWVQNAYLLTLAAMVITAGRLGDIFGRRRVYIWGMSIFAAGSVIAALAGSQEMLIAARVVQGLGGAAMFTLSLALASNVFPPERQAQAVGIWAAVSAIALGIGPLVGGVLIEAASWRWIFWTYLPFCALGIVILLVATRESRDETSGARLDVRGAVVISTALTLIILAMVESERWGWDSPLTYAVLGTGVALLGLFWVVEHRVEDPIVDFSLFRNGPFFGASAAAVAMVGTFWAMMFFEPQFLQNALGYGVITAGLLILPITVPMIVISPFAGSLIGRFGPRAVMLFGMLLALAGILVLTRVDGSSDYADLLPGFLAFGLALGFVYAPMSSAAMAAMPREKAGIAAGVLGMERLMAGAVLLAICGAIFQTLQNDRVNELVASRTPAGVPTADAHELEGLLAGSPEARAALPKQGPSLVERIEEAARDAFAYALSRALYVLVALIAVGTVLTALLVPGRAGPRSPPEPRAEPEPPDLHHHVHHRRFHL